jgi:DNA-binding NtrC family response regulator
MMQVRLFSQDRELQLYLSGALGKEFQFLLDAEKGDSSQQRSDERTDVVLIDLNSLDDSHPVSIEYARGLIASQVYTIILADEDLRATADELVRQGALGCCQNPPSIRDLTALLRQAQRHSQQKRNLRNGAQRLELLDSCDRMIGASAAMQQVYHLVRCVADHSASVLVTGESGTGKELIARAIHNMGIRASSPFVAVSCGAIPETLLEAELFGHEKGAFTGTVGLREGHFETVGNGTLFLDEIGDLTLFAQVKLLRVLQQREFSRLGSSRLIPLRARLVFATHRDLQEMVAEGKFRQDLYYRLNVIRIEAPPLREHPEDIPQMAAYFLRQYAQMYQMPPCDIESDALELMSTYHWPGNVRELEHLIQSCLILCGGESIRAVDLPNHLRQDKANVLGIDGCRPGESFEQQLIDYKIKLATEAVRDNNGNKTLAARSLNISRAYLHRLLRLDDPDQALAGDGIQAEAL